jgi:DNA polymerase I-like protein with 3'-5' exonuclease and polymerase domains
MTMTKQPWPNFALRADLSDLERRVALTEGYGGSAGDLHTNKAADAFGVPAARVTPEQRRFGKALNYAHWYGWEAPRAPVQYGDAS